MVKESNDINQINRRLAEVAKEIRLIQEALAGITATEPTRKSDPVQIKTGTKTYTI